MPHTINLHSTHGDNIRNNILSLQLECPPMGSNSTEANLNFVSYADTSSIPNTPTKEKVEKANSQKVYKIYTLLVNSSQVIGRQNNLTSTTLK